MKGARERGAPVGLYFAGVMLSIEGGRGPDKALVLQLLSGPDDSDSTNGAGRMSYRLLNGPDGFFKMASFGETSDRRCTLPGIMGALFRPDGTVVGIPIPADAFPRYKETLENGGYPFSPER